MHDLVVVGAGCAGSAAALEAAELGLDVLLIEKEALPRYKLCGGGISRKTLDLLHGRGVEIPESIIEAKVDRLKMVTPSFSTLIETDETIVVLTYRDKFDYFLAKLAEKAGAEIKDKTSFIDVSFHNEYCEVETSREKIKARCVIAADGVNSRVARKAGLPAKPPKNRVVAAAEFEIPDAPETGCIEFHFGQAKFGYGWVFPKRSGSTIGIGELVSNLGGASIRDVLYEFVKKFSLKSLPEPKSHLIPLGGSSVLAGRRVALCGDAAWLVDAVAGEGTYYAINSGFLAARSAAEVASGRAESMQSYQRVAEEEILPDLRASLGISNHMYANLDFFYHLLEKEHRIRKMFSWIATREVRFPEIYREGILLSLKNYPGFVLSRLQQYL